MVHNCVSYLTPIEDRRVFAKFEWGTVKFTIHDDVVNITFQRKTWTTSHIVVRNLPGEHNSSCEFCIHCRRAMNFQFTTHPRYSSGSQMGRRLNAIRISSHTSEILETSETPRRDFWDTVTYTGTIPCTWLKSRIGNTGIWIRSHWRPIRRKPRKSPSPVGDYAKSTR